MAPTAAAGAMQSTQLLLQSPGIFGSIPSPGEALQSGGPLILLRSPYAGDGDAAYTA